MNTTSNFDFDAFDEMADAACDNIKAAARRFVSSGAIDESECGGASPMLLPKAALCAALRQEVDQWRLRGIITAEEKNLMHF